MADPTEGNEEMEGMTEADRRHFDFMETLLKISDALSNEETANVKLYCMHLIPKGRRENLHRAVDVFVALLELRKIDQENLVFLEAILERIGRPDLIRDILRPFLRPDREIPENPELQPGTSSEATDEEGSSTSNAYVVLHGRVRMVQETLDRLRNDLARLAQTRRSQVKFRGYKKHRSILVHFTIPRESTAVLRLMANLSDPRLVFMGVTSLQIDAEPPIKVAQGALFNDIKRQQTVDDIEVGCSTRTKQQRAPRNWTNLSALNLFSDALPLHLQVAASLEYQGFSYGLVQALVQKDQLREQEMKKKDELREQEMKRLIQKAEVDSNTIMTLHSKLTISENRLKEALEANAVLEKNFQQAREYAEKAAKQITAHVTEYKGEKPPGGWSQEYRGEKPPGGWSQEYRGEKPSGGWPAQVEKADLDTQTHLASHEETAGEEVDTGETTREESTAKDADKSTERDEKEDRLSTQQTETERPASAGAEGAAPRTTGDLEQGKITFGGEGSEPGKFRAPRGVLVSPSNEIFVTDTYNRRVQVHNTKGVYLNHFPTVVPGTDDREMEPQDVSMDGNGALWVVGRGDSADHVVQYSTGGIIMTQFHLRKSRYYRGIVVDIRNNHVLVTDKDRGEVEVFRPDDSLVRRFGHPEMKDPRYITVDREGNILVSNPVTDSVYMYDESGQFLLRFGGEGSGERSLRGICTDSSGHILVADRVKRRVQMFTRHGEYVRSVETGLRVHGVAVGPEGQLAVWTDHPENES
ncbi:hypothetical protein Bbelb_108610 [Branchiostoma belcheri]|nr:hypothetical protein Bbelb_108610 [Branchiostoma belcheri]